MRTTDVRLQRRLKESRLLTELPPTDAAELVASIRPTLDRIRRGELTLIVDGARTPADRDALALFPSRVCELIDLIEARG